MAIFLEILGMIFKRQTLLLANLGRFKIAKQFEIHQATKEKIIHLSKTFKTAANLGVDIQPKVKPAMLRKTAK